MGFVRRLIEESNKQLKDVAKQMNEAMKAELERQANEANSQRQQGSSSSSIHRTDTNNYNYNYNYIYPTNNNENVQQETRGESRPVTFADLESEEQQLRNMYRQLIDDQIRQAEKSITRTGTIGMNDNNMVYVNSRLPVDPIAQEQQLRNTRQKLIDDQIRRADESITRMGAIGTGNNVVYVNNNLNVQTPSYVNSASRVDPISQEQQLRNMRQKLIDNQIRRADESMTRMGVIGTNNELVYTNDTLGNIR
ncbi:uncharacterized protein LOC141612723 [Silene latifolia]|uniref:uncharacterized protein LOC141612723 n=1 Tax=Silene latifolia TaxID=37657 RepID=UPI003D76C6E7